MKISKNKLHLIEIIISLLFLIGLAISFIINRDAKHQVIKNNKEGEVTMNLDTYVNEALDNIKALELIQSDELLDKQLLDNFHETPEEILESMDATQIYGMIFDYIGGGKYDYDTWDWTPSSDKIYSFDTEAFNIDKMYTFFLTGISTITSNDIKIDNIIEDTSQVDYESGTGKQIISFQCNGKHYQFEANVYYDWFDTEMITYMKSVIEEQGTGKHLWVTSDGYQNCIVFYETEEWANKFSSYTGYILE